MYNIKISDETGSALFRDIFTQDYLGLKDDIRKLEALTDIDSLDSKDLEFNRRMVAAFEVLMEYYFTDADAERLKNG